RNVVLPGHDGVTGTDDDFVARCQRGRIESLEIPGRAVYHAAAARIEERAGESLPSVEDGGALLAGLKDPWGNPLRYDLLDSAHARIVSAGPDKRGQTDWDQGILLEKAAGGGAVEKDSWLARRKRQLGVADAPVDGGFRRVEFSGGQSTLEGAAYFSFFTWLVLGTAIVFLPFAWLYRPRTYLHD
ncbi:MAG TPA: hypothetical protein VIM46_02445, partial [Luteolibacter sp.]